MPKTIALGAVTDPYQPIERTLRITRGILEVLDARSHPVGIVTKSAGVVRDIDILARMAERGLVKVGISVTTLDRKLARGMEPRAATPPKRLEAIAAGGGRRARTLMVAPIMPAHQRQRDRGASWRRRARPAPARPAMCCCGCRWN